MKLYVKLFLFWTLAVMAVVLFASSSKAMTMQFDYSEIVEVGEQAEDVINEIVRGQTLYSESNYAQALQVFTELIERLPNQTFPYHSAAIIAYRIGEVSQSMSSLNDSVNFYQQAIEHGLDDEQINFGLGAAYYKLKLMPEAKKYFTKAVLKGNKRAYAGLASAHQFLGEHNAAITNFKKALQYEPNNFIYHFNIANSYYMLKEYDNSKQWLKSIREDVNKSGNTELLDIVDKFIAQLDTMDS